jgi:aryl sulfotransferase
MTTLQRAPSREVRTMIMESSRWAGFPVRPDDIVIATYSKCGTTWTQRIVDLLVFQDPAPRPVFLTSIWLDARIFAPHEQNMATLEAQTHRRFIKSHLPLDALPLWDTVKYIHVARDGRDAFMSWHNHLLGMNPDFRPPSGADEAAAAPPRPPVPEDPSEFFQAWIAEAEADLGPGPDHGLSYFDFENTYWAERSRRNLLLVHYNDLKADLAGEMRRISAFLGIDTPEGRLPTLAAAAEFGAMKADGAALMPGIEALFDRGAERFLNKGTNGRWKDALTPADLARYDAVARRKLSPSLAAWLEHGRRVAGEPRDLPD